ncbi:ABC transporter ATP-binding protein [Roseofilum reptotaenium CS-1145]|uniref:ABC transporter ATP-binding protein n=1 Tax=Roseofilum reptotaenium AO1-A TaxID=1925591 RepID=A0A1L9QSB1_9CYAN|nr:ABC transporter ATP-binding protein [Roseofilum reptotaenium]MDB9518335.1 ABC transporter ATP-binding protein [Roseofilum reptotaenium CS-1145]OJJ25467.1 ABC transporter ATP-binding protein [Roseofilum reptotaenium AO1-A]
MAIIAAIASRFQRLLYLRKAVQLVWESTPKLTLTNIALVGLQSVLPLISLYLTKLIIDRITEGISTPQTSLKPVFVLIAIAALVAILADGLRSLAGWVSEAQSQIVTDYVQNLLHAKSIEVDLEYYENAQYYDVLHQAQTEASYRPPLILNRLIQLGNSSLSLVGIGILLFSLDWAIALILVIAAIPVFLVRLKFSQQLYYQWQQWTPQERMAYYYSTLITQVDHAKELRLFDLGKLFQRRFNTLRQGIRQQRISLSARRSFAESITQSSATLAVFTAFALMADRALTGAITIGSLVMYYQAFQRGQTLLRESLSYLASLYENSLFLSTFYQFLDLTTTIREPSHPVRLPAMIEGKIEFEQVSFSYPRSQRSVLEDVHFTIEPGETIAIVGENGAGKTTLIKLLCRLYDPTAGTIRLDGVDLRDLSPTQVRKQISIVFQDYAHYHLTVQENIGVGDIQHWDNLALIKRAAELAKIQDVIMQLPQGYDTILGKQLINGEELSIGEWQKVAIARSFLRQNHPILILDEPTSALDPQAEAEILEQLNQLTQKRTSIIISHRLSTVKFADRILVLKEGKIVETGNHRQLMEKSGIYATLFNTQAHYYR